MEARNPKVYGRYLLFIRERDHLVYSLRSRPKYFEEIFHGLQLNFVENFQCWLAIFHLWLLTVRSQFEAKGRTIEMNGSQEAKGLWLLSNICMKTRPFSVKPIIEAKIL